MTQKNWVDFAAIKSAVSMEMVLDHYGIELRRVNTVSLRGRCPLPTHTGQSENSFGVHTLKNAWACHAASCVANREGRKGGNVLDFVAVMEGCTVREAAVLIQNWFAVAAEALRPMGYIPSRERHRKTGKEKRVAEGKDGGRHYPPQSAGEGLHESEADEIDSEVVNPPLEFALKSVDPSHESLWRRGIKPETAQSFGVGYFYGKGSMKGRVVIPIHDEMGELIGYAGRATDTSEPKYKLPTGFRKSRVLFNLHRVLDFYRSIEGLLREVILVEGYFDTLKVHQAGFENVVALMGASLSEFQHKLIARSFDHVIVMLDGDEGGRTATVDVVSRLTRDLFVRVVSVPDGKQPDQLSSEAIRGLLGFLEAPHQLMED